MYPELPMFSGVVANESPHVKKWRLKSRAEYVKLEKQGSLSKSVKQKRGALFSTNHLGYNSSFEPKHAVDVIKKDLALKKTITYRIAVGVLGAGLVWVATGNIFATAGISVTTEVMRTAVYYAHEKVYEGKKKDLN